MQASLTEGFDTSFTKDCVKLPMAGKPRQGIDSSLAKEDCSQRSSHTTNAPRQWIDLLRASRPLVAIVLHNITHRKDTEKRVSYLFLDPHDEPGAHHRLKGDLRNHKLKVPHVAQITI